MCWRAEMVFQSKHTSKKQWGCADATGLNKRSKILLPIILDKHATDAEWTVDFSLFYAWIFTISDDTHDGRNPIWHLKPWASM